MIISVRLSDDLVKALDGLGGKRSDLIREAIGLLLERDAQVSPPISSVVKVAKKSDSVASPQKRDFSADFPAVLTAISDHRYSTRDLVRVLNWPEMKVERVVGEMGKAGLVTFDRGAVVPA